MNTILTDDEIEDAWCKYGDEMGGADQSDALRIGREIEAAVLAKLAQQEPVAWMREGWGPDCGPYVEFYRDDEMDVLRERKDFIALYTHPSPQQADRQRVSEGWGADPSAAAVELAKMIMSDCGLAVEHRHDLLGRIAARIEKFAAAPEAPAQASLCPDGLLPDGPVCPRCGIRRGPSGIDGGKWVHCPSALAQKGGAA